MQVRFGEDDVALSFTSAEPIGRACAARSIALDDDDERIVSVDRARRGASRARRRELSARCDDARTARETRVGRERRPPRRADERPRGRGQRQGRRNRRGGPRARRARGDEDGACAEPPRAGARQGGACRGGRAGLARASFWSSWSPHHEARIRRSPTSTRRCARPCAASLRARSRRMPPHGTRRRNSRASFTGRPPPRACSASAFPEEYGGTPADLFTHVILAEEIALAGCRRRACRAVLAPDRLAAGRQRGQRRAESARAAAACSRARRSARSPSPSRAAARTWRSCAPRAPRRRRLHRQRREDLHHLRHARRLLHRGGAHRRAGRVRRLAAADRARARQASRARR